MRNRTHLTMSFAALLGVGLAALTGCQSFGAAAAAPQLRIVNLSADAGTLDVYHSSRPMVYNLGFGAVSSYIAVEPGSATTTITRSGSRQALSTLHETFAPGLQYTVLVRHSAAGLEEVLLPGHSTIPSVASPTVRFVHEAEHSGAVDIYLAPPGHRFTWLKPVAENVLPGSATAYIPVASGRLSALIVPAGTNPAEATALHLGAQLNYGPGSARTLILLEGPEAASLRVIAATDVEALP